MCIGTVWLRYYNLFPVGEWNNDLTLLSDLLQFSREEEEGHFCLPQDWKGLFKLIVGLLQSLLSVCLFIVLIDFIYLAGVTLLDKLCRYQDDMRRNQDDMRFDMRDFQKSIRNYMESIDD